MSDPAPPSRPTHVPAPLLAAAGLVAVEGLLTAMYGVVEILHTSAGRVVMGVTTGLFLAAYGVVLLVCAWGMRGLRPWSRGPVLLTQLILLGMAWSFRETVAVAVALAVVGGLVLAGVLHPSSVDALNRDERRGPRP